MNYNDEKIKLITELHRLNIIDVNWLKSQFGFITPEEERAELRKSRKDKLNNIFGNDI